MGQYREAVVNALRDRNDFEHVVRLLKIIVSDDNTSLELVKSSLEDFISAADQVIKETK